MACHQDSKALDERLAEAERLLAELHNAVGDPRPIDRVANARTAARAFLAAAAGEGEGPRPFPDPLADSLTGERNR